MKTIAEFKNIHKGQDIYVVGTGPSLRYFPLDFLKNKIIIGLNQAYKQFDPTYSITIHPYLIPINSKDWNTKWLTKQKKADSSWNVHLANGNLEKFYFFQKQKDNLDFSYISSNHKSDRLYVGCGIQTGGLHLAALMGASTAILVGCDMSSIGKDHHCDSQHTQFHNVYSEWVYDEYYFYTVKIRSLLRKYYNINIISLSPFLSLKRAKKDADYLQKELCLPDLPPAQEIETNARTSDLVRDFIQ